jgi:MATE family multidrug resistance protein
VLDKEKSKIITPEVGVPHNQDPVVEKKRPSARLIPSFLAGLQDFSYGESYTTIFGYFWPELVSAMLLTSFLPMIDSLWIATLQSTTTYATLNVTQNFIHFMLKVAEGLQIGAVVLSGQYNGVGDYQTAGRTLRDGFWSTVLVGGILSGVLFFGAYWIYAAYGVPQSMIALGVPYLRLQAVRVFFMFIYLFLVGFMRGVKNTKTPMQIFMIGAALFLFFDYALIHGVWGFPALRMQGSAVASVIQYGVMCGLSLLYVFFHKDNEKYQISLFSGFANWHNTKRIFQMSWPAMIDKATFAGGTIWLGSMVTSMGKYAIASFGVIKDLERFAFLPAIAFANVITLLVSNAYKRHDWQGIKSNLKKVLFLTATSVMTILVFVSFYAKEIIQYFDYKGKFTDFSAGILPYISVLAFFDLLQIILSGALRGTGNVKTVMYVRLAVCVGYFGPVSYFLSKAPIQDEMLKFALIYGSFYLGHAIMAAFYIRKLRGDSWQQPLI